MARLMIVGEWAQVELVRNVEDGGAGAVCRQHRRRRCTWTEEYVTVADAVASPSVERHADSE